MELVPLLQLIAAYSPHGLAGLVIAVASVFTYIKLSKRFKVWLTDVIANTPRSKEAQNGMRQLVESMHDQLKDNTKKTYELCERVAKIEGQQSMMTKREE